LRANASRLQINGGWAGVVGAVPANGFSTNPMTFDTSLVTAVSGFSGVVVTVCCVVSTDVTWAAIIGDISVGDAAARVRASANTATWSAD
jgi:hypothetical protein